MHGCQPSSRSTNTDILRPRVRYTTSARQQLQRRRRRRRRNSTSGSVSDESLVATTSETLQEFYNFLPAVDVRTGLLFTDVPITRAFVPTYSRPTFYLLFLQCCVYVILSSSVKVVCLWWPSASSQFSSSIGYSSYSLRSRGHQFSLPQLNSFV